MRARSSARRLACTRRDAASSSRSAKAEQSGCKHVQSRLSWAALSFDAALSSVGNERRVMIKVGVVGGTGYTGVELLRILAAHPDVEVTAITSRGEAGVKVADYFPSLRGRYDLAFSDPA